MAFMSTVSLGTLIAHTTIFGVYPLLRLVIATQCSILLCQLRSEYVLYVVEKPYEAVNQCYHCHANEPFSF